VQGSAVWSPPSGTLGLIIGQVAARVTELNRTRDQLERAASDRDRPPQSLRESLDRPTVGVIAEIKRRSPSKGLINEGISAVDQAHAYADGGAAAISVLTEPNHFQGSIDDLDAVVEDLDLPVLKKDFHVDPIQLVEARAHGATAVLLIVRALAPGALESMMNASRTLGLETIVEIRTEDELKRALDAGAEIVGINNRNLETLVIDPTTCERLLPLVPGTVTAIAESGMSTVTDVKRAASFGADAVLVGSSLSASDDPESLVRHLASVPRERRGA
jgi:indole-3-glycerol phosphate synthase